MSLETFLKVVIDAPFYYSRFITDPLIAVVVAEFFCFVLLACCLTMNDATFASIYSPQREGLGQATSAVRIFSKQRWKFPSVPSAHACLRFFLKIFYRLFGCHKTSRRVAATNLLLGNRDAEIQEISTSKQTLAHS